MVGKLTYDTQHSMLILFPGLIAPLIKTNVLFVLPGLVKVEKYFQTIYLVLLYGKDGEF